MPLVKIKQKYQVTLPASVRKKVKVAVGDLLEARVRGKTSTLTPKMAIDRDIDLALEDFKRGRFIGPFRTAKAAIRALRRAAK
ncbi:MAG: AbrB/MazE/SpoVT family DNA-binding domain-containing protein [candidate division NC10 bacterium]|nr:AbrB/MazE/SpoVT family DNA-binding domain-containing protein [candidate division NC10 bacterium]